MIPFQTPEDFIPKIPNILSRRNSSVPFLPLPQVERVVPTRLTKRAGTARSTWKEKRARRSRSTAVIRSHNEFYEPVFDCLYLHVR